MRSTARLLCSDAVAVDTLIPEAGWLDPLPHWINQLRTLNGKVGSRGKGMQRHNTKHSGLSNVLRQTGFYFKLILKSPRSCPTAAAVRPRSKQNGSRRDRRHRSRSEHSQLLREEATQMLPDPQCSGSPLRSCFPIS